MRMCKELPYELPYKNYHIAIYNYHMLTIAIYQANDTIAQKKTLALNLPQKKVTEFHRYTVAIF